MGFLDHLFKPKPNEEKTGEGDREKDAAGGNGESAGAGPDPGAFLQPKSFVPRGGATIYPPIRQAAPAGRKPAAEERRQEIVITLGDVLSRIPTQLLQAGLHDEKRELRFSIDDLSSDIARGRAAVPLSKIAALCPDVFSRGIAPEDDTEIRLPLQKLVEQIGLLRGRPAPPPGVAPSRSAVPASALAKDSPSAAEASPASGEEEIHLSLAAILPGCPPEILVGQLPPIAADVRITLPYAPIERQFANDRVEVSARRFISVLPPALQPYFEPRDGVKVPLPIEEILGNLPGLPEPADAAAPTPPETLPPAAMPPSEEPIHAPAPAGILIHPPPMVRPMIVPPPPILAASEPSPAPAEPAPPALATPAVPRGHEALQALFMTDEVLDLAAICRHAAALPGVLACALEVRGEKAFSGEPAEGFDLAALHTAAVRMSDAALAAGPLPLGTWQNITLHGDQAAISLFTRPGLLLAVLHRPLPPGVRERLATVAAELAGP